MGREENSSEAGQAGYSCVGEDLTGGSPGLMSGVGVYGQLGAFAPGRGSGAQNKEGGKQGEACEAAACVNDPAKDAAGDGGCRCQLFQGDTGDDACYYEEEDDRIQNSAFCV